MKKIFLVILFLSFGPSIFAQEQLKEGFTLLERGKFSDAALFFKDYLTKVDSTNKTALICYGRGTGLSGNVEEAKGVFLKLLNRFPGDYETRLNLAESYMWAKDYKSAKKEYEELIAIDSTSFSANLGYANVLSNLKEYDLALIQINRSLAISPHDKSGNHSKKYILLGYAYELQKTQQYDLAKSYLRQILKEEPTDPQANFLLAQIYTQEKNYDEAIRINEKLLSEPSNHNKAYLNLSYLSHQKEEDRDALIYAQYAVNEASPGSEEYLDAKLGEATAFAWQSKYKKAFSILNELEAKFPNNAKVFTKKAGILTWDKSYRASLDYFNRALKLDPDSFDANLGIADTYFAQEEDKKSMTAVKKTLALYPNQIDATNFQKKIINRHMPNFGISGFQSSDAGGNSALNYSGIVNFDAATRLRLKISYVQRDAKNDREKIEASTKNLTLGTRTRINPYWILKVEGSYLQTVKDNFLYYISNKFFVSKNQELELIYHSGFQDFTAGLIKNNFTFKNYSAIYNLNTAIRLGLYGQYHYTQTSDANTRQLAFASLYYQAIRKPVLKFAINFNWMTFEKQRPELYFSPSIFKSLEFYSLLENLEIPKQKFLYHLSGAYGYQQIEKEKYQSAYRYRIESGFKIEDQFNLLGYYMFSNSATSTVAGYSYQEYGLNLKYFFTK